MAVIRGMEVSIKTYGRKLREHNTEVDPINSTVKCFIMVNAGERYSIIHDFNNDEGVKFVSYQVRVDGCFQRSYRGPRLVNEISRTSRFCEPMVKESRPFIFSNIIIASHGDNEFETRTDVIQKAGSIEVNVYKCIQQTVLPGTPLDPPRITRFDRPLPFRREDLRDEITLQTTLGPAEYDNWQPKPHEYTYPDADGGRVKMPWATFVFFYRDEPSLYNMGIIPMRPPKIEALSEGGVPIDGRVMEWCNNVENAKILPPDDNKALKDEKDQSKPPHRPPNYGTNLLSDITISDQASSQKTGAPTTTTGASSHRN